MAVTKLTDRLAAWAAAWQAAQQRWREATAMQRAQIGLATRKSKTRLDRGHHKQYASLNQDKPAARRRRQMERNAAKRAAREARNG
jgi:hypothetical protein